jgi:hypothetical protein
MKVRSPSFQLDRKLIRFWLEMVENMKTVASTDQELSVEERNLLSVAYKNVIGARRASWRIVSSIEQKEESKGNEAQVALIKEYRTKIEQELAKICDDILGVLDGSLIPAAGSGESKVFYYKMYTSPSLVPHFIHSLFLFVLFFSPCFFFPVIINTGCGWCLFQ